MESKHKLSINQWALEDRPREKMMEKGAAALSDAELLAILIGSGNTEESAVELMRRLLLSCGIRQPKKAARNQRETSNHLLKRYL